MDEDRLVSSLRTRIHARIGAAVPLMDEALPGFMQLMDEALPGLMQESMP